MGAGGPRISILNSSELLSTEHTQVAEYVATAPTDREAETRADRIFRMITAHEYGIDDITHTPTRIGVGAAMACYLLYPYVGALPTIQEGEGTGIEGTPLADAMREAGMGTPKTIPHKHYRTLLTLAARMLDEDAMNRVGVGDEGDTPPTEGGEPHETLTREFLEHPDVLQELWRIPEHGLVHAFGRPS